MKHSKTSKKSATTTLKILCVSSLLLSMATLQAAFKIPEGVYTSSQLEEARAKAASEKMAIVYVLTDSEST